MTTLLSVRQAMLAQEPMLGRVENIASLTAQSLTVTVLATGTVGEQKFSEKWLLRPQAANAANRAPRLSSMFNAATGTITHAGSAYTDTTATSETVEIHEYEPWLLEEAIQNALAQLRYVDTSIMQGRSDGHYTFQNFSWIAQPNDVWRIGRRNSLILTANRRFEQWGTVSSAGVLQPDRWTLAGGGTFTRSSTSRVGQYSLSVVRATSDATVGQTIQAVTSGISGEALRGEPFTGVLVCQTTTGSAAFVRVTSELADGTVLSTTDSSYHTGGGAWEELTAAHTVASTADIVRVQARVAADSTVLMDDCYGVAGTLSDTERRGRYETDWIKGQWEQNPLTWWGPYNRHIQIVVKSRRPYPQFDSTRVAAGSADTDVTDCDVNLLAFKALSLLFEGLAKDQNGNAAMQAKADEYKEKADNLASAHLADVDEDQPGARLYSGISYGRMARVR